jgi:uncharacterized membrane protein
MVEQLAVCSSTLYRGYNAISVVMIIVIIMIVVIIVRRMMNTVTIKSLLLSP